MSSKRGRASLGTAPGSVVMAAKCEYIAKAHRELKKVILKKQSTEYPNQGIKIKNVVQIIP